MGAIDNNAGKQFEQTGGGFGGCTINLVANEAVAEFQPNVASAYEKSTGLVPRIFATTAAQGVAEVLR